MQDFLNLCTLHDCHHTSKMFAAISTVSYLNFTTGLRNKNWKQLWTPALLRCMQFLELNFLLSNCSENGLCIYIFLPDLLTFHQRQNMSKLHE